VRPSKRVVAAAVGCAFSAALLAWLLAQLDWSVFWAALAQARLDWIAAAMLVLIASIAVRSARWEVLAAFERGRLRDFFRAASIGYLGNYIYPLRAGELMRVIALKQLVAGASLGRTLAAAALDRAFDLVGVGVFMALVLHQHGVAALGAQAVRAAAGLIGFAALSIAVFVFTARYWGGLVAAVARRLPERPAAWLRHGYGQALEAAGAASPARLAGAFALSLLASVLDYLAVWALLSAFNWPLGALAAVTVGLFVQIGGSLPSAPGYVGVIQVACVLALALFGVSRSEAVAFSVLYQLTLLSVVVACGLWAAASAGLSLSARRAAAQAERG
jgi:glycosyltransferase 2 family protein